jgi:hypothetical protein
MNFDRFRVQSNVELQVGCRDLINWSSYKQQFESYEINFAREKSLLPYLMLDAADIYYNGLFSLLDAIRNISEGKHSWSVIKLYYSIFYFLRCSLATRKYAFVKNNGIYTIKIQPGELPIRRDIGKHQGERVSGDHKTTIKTYIDLVGQDDILQTNTIDGTLVYYWLMELRNQVNYRERSFHEPYEKHFPNEVFDKAKISSMISTYVDDDSYSFCFLPDHCCLATPIKVALHTRRDLSNFVDFEPIIKDKQQVLNSLIKGSGLASIKKIVDLVKFEKS